MNAVGNQKKIFYFIFIWYHIWNDYVCTLRQRVGNLFVKRSGKELEFKWSYLRT